uniref:Fibronectin type-III domain-containing protein n=1 Tax=Amphiprion ocellaris TaxID=80972 RepID=A0AAQ5ZG98_AMPOC
MLSLHSCIFLFLRSGTKFGNIEGNSIKIVEEELIRARPVDIWVEAYVGDSNCTSTRRSVILEDTVKYETPQNISVTWLKNNLSLSWQAAEKYPALAEVWFRPYEHPTESWEKIVVGNLLKHSAYEVQIRQQSSEAKNPLWSNWSPVVIVPAGELIYLHKWITAFILFSAPQMMPHAAAVSGVTYILSDTQSSQGCPCEEKRKKHHTDMNKHTIYVPYSAVNISVIARNAAGSSPPAVVQIPTEPVADLKSRLYFLLIPNFYATLMKEVEQVTSADQNTLSVSVTDIKDYIRYLYFEHRCEGGRPQTVKMCLFYHKEGAPAKEPQDLIAFNEAQSSANLSWKAIPYKDQRGFLTHYKLCRVKIGSQDEPEGVKVTLLLISLAVKHRLENLTPGAKYNISLAGVTRVGEGPKATITINTWSEKHLNGMGFVINVFCSVLISRIKNKIFPPVPTPVIPDFTPCPKCQEMLENKEEVHDLTLYQVHSEGKSLSEEAEETTVLGGEWDDGTDEDVENKRSDSGGSGDECLSPGSANQALKTDLEQVDNELTMLIYRTGLVFDMKTDL